MSGKGPTQTPAIVLPEHPLIVVRAKQKATALGHNRLMPGTIPSDASESSYQGLAFPPAPADRPYVFVNMVTTIDGKTVTGERTEHVTDLGSKVDHAAMRSIEDASDAVMIGAQTLRAHRGLWYPKRLFRIVVTRSGGIDTQGRFFTDVPEKAVIACPEEAPIQAPAGVGLFRKGKGEVDMAGLLEYLRTQLGITRLLVEGGSELNAAVLSKDLVDELFLTVAPKVRLGRNLPTYAGGEPLPRDRIQAYELISVVRVGDEVFLRYRRKR